MRIEPGGAGDLGAIVLTGRAIVRLQAPIHATYGEASAEVVEHGRG